MSLESFLDIKNILIIAAAIILFAVVLRILKVSKRIVTFLIWVIVVTLLVYFSLPFLDPFMQEYAKKFNGGTVCYGLILESGDCFGFVK